MRRLFGFRLVLGLLTLAMALGPAARAAEPRPEEGARFDNLIQVRSAGGVVATESPEASQVGLDVLKHGGNAVDAAIATVFAIGVTRPEMCGIGGGGFLIYRGADGTDKALDFRETAPAAMGPNTFNKAGDPTINNGSTAEERPGIHSQANFRSGHMVVGVPGVVAGMDEALQRLGSGKHTLGELITNGDDSARPPYAHELARDGIRVTWRLQLNLFAYEFLLGQRFANYPETARTYSGAYRHGPRVYSEIDEQDPTRFKQVDYAKSLKQIIDHGREAFYQDHLYDNGERSIGGLIADDMAGAEAAAKANPVLMAKTSGTPNDIGLITPGDLSSYQAEWRTPLKAHYRDHQVIAMPPPTSGGVATIEMLNLLENFKLPSFGFGSADHLHVLAEAQKLAWADRNAYLADPDFLYDYDGDGRSEAVPTETLTSKRYAQQRVSEIDMKEAQTVEGYGKGTLQPGHEGQNTTHISVTDRVGNAVAVTCSLQDPFGSSVVAPGTGFLLNNQLSDFNWCWGELVNETSGTPCVKTGEQPANAPAAGKRPRSSASPTVVVKDGRSVLVTGGAGGPTIIAGVVQNILNVVDFDMDIFHAIDQRRIDATNARIQSTGCPWNSLAVDYRGTEGEDEVLGDLGARGHSICRIGSPPSDGYGPFPLVQSVGTDLVTGERLAVSDPRNFSPPNEDLRRFGHEPQYGYEDQGPAGE